MAPRNSIALQIGGFIRRGRLILLGALLSVPISFLAAVTCFTAAGREYSIQSLALAVGLGSLVLTWFVAFGLRRIFAGRWVASASPVRAGQVLVFVGLIALFGYASWSAYKPALRMVSARFDVEIASGNGARGHICVLTISNRDGVIRSKTAWQLGTVLAGDWIAGKGHCLYYSTGSLPGRLRFSYYGPLDDSLTFSFPEEKDPGKIFVHRIGRQQPVFSAPSSQAGITQATATLAGPALFIYGLLAPVGWIALLLLLLPVFSVLFSYVLLHPRFKPVGALFQRAPWILLTPMALAAVILFWPTGIAQSADVAYYLSLAKSIFHGNGYVNPDQSAAIYRGPVWPFLISLGYLVFGESFRSALIVERIFWVLTILVTYFLGKRVFNHRVGVLAALFVLATRTIDVVYYRIWVDGVAAFAVLLLQLVTWELFKNRAGAKGYVLLGILMGTAYLTKQTALFIVPLPLLVWAVFSEYRTQRGFKLLLVAYLVFALFFFGWMGYVRLAGGSWIQATGDLRKGIYLLDYLGRSVRSVLGGSPVLSEQARPSGALLAPLEILSGFYKQDIHPFFKELAIIFPATLLYCGYEALVRRSRAAVFLALGLLLFSSLIPVEVVGKYGPRHNLYFYVIVLLCFAAMLDQIAARMPQLLPRSWVWLVAAIVVLFQVRSIDFHAHFSLEKYQQPVDYFPEYADIAAWVHEHVKPGENILIYMRQARILHILTAGNRQFELLNICIGDQAFEPFRACTPPLIDFWVYNGVTDEDNPRAYLRGISENELISTIHDKDVKYVIVTPQVYPLVYYLRSNPAFEETVDLGVSAVFRVNPPVHPMITPQNWTTKTCIGAGTPEYLRNLRENNPAGYEARLRDELGPWMGLSRRDLEIIENWKGCQLPAVFPGNFDQHSVIAP